MRFERCAFALAVWVFGCGSDGKTPATAGSGGQAGGGSGGGSGFDASSGGSVGDVDSSDGSEALHARSFRLGFTPFPYDISLTAQNWVYAKLETDADLYAFHTTEGVPWVEAELEVPFEQYGQGVRDKWAEHRAHVSRGHAVYLALTPLDDSRTRIADYWGDQAHMPLPSPWNAYPLDAPEVQRAYLNFCRQAIAYYSPDYLAIGIEVNLLLTLSPASWPAYLALHRATYTALKTDNPNLPIFVTVTAVDLLEGWTNANRADQMQALQELLPYTDILGISFYPYMSAYLTNPSPADVYDQLKGLAQNKPIAIAESGYVAEAFSIAAYDLSFDGTPDKQNNFVVGLLQAAEAHQMPFVVNFVLRDYDALWEKLPAESRDLGSVWRDTGFYDEAGNERPALATWRQALLRPTGG
jgi:hypothetical protein